MAQTNQQLFNDNFVVIADSGAGDTNVTVTNKSEHAVAYHLDDRAVGSRPDINHTLKAYEEKSFYALDGQLRMKAETAGNAGTLVVTK